MADVEIERAGRNGRALCEPLDDEVQIHGVGGEGPKRRGETGLGGDRDQKMTEASGAERARQAREGTDRLRPFQHDVERLDGAEYEGIEPARGAVIPQREPRRAVAAD